MSGQHGAPGRKGRAQDPDQTRYCHRSGRYAATGKAPVDQQRDQVREENGPGLPLAQGAEVQ
ncbi:hypothetical protein D9M73_181100 [compost metagenome]